MNDEINYFTIVYTRYQSATAHKGARIVAHGGHATKKIEQTYDCRLSGEANHRAAAVKYITKRLAGDGAAPYYLIGQSDNPTGSGLAYVFSQQEI